MAGTARLFVALELPADACATLARWRAPLLRDAGDALRAVAPASLHVTLCFLGDQPSSAIAAIAAAVIDAADGVRVGGLALGDALWLPRRRPRVLAVAVRDPAGRLTALQAALAGALAAGGWYAPERRRFLPHVTVARVRDASALPGGLVRGAPAAPPALEVAAVAATLMRSHLGGGPVRYEPLARAALA